MYYLLLIILITHEISAQVTLKKGTDVFIELTTEANSNNRYEIVAIVGMDVNDIKTGETLITKGTPVKLKVERRKSRGVGKAGWLQIKPISTVSIDGHLKSWFRGRENEILFILIILNS